MTAFEVHRSSLANARLEASAQVANYSNKDEKIRILLKADGKTLAEREVAVSTGKTASATFEGLPEYPYYVAEIDARDALTPGQPPLCGCAAVARPQGPCHYAPASSAPASLRSIPGVTVDVIAPTDYEKSERAGYGLEIFHFASRQQLAAHSSAVHSAAGE